MTYRVNVSYPLTWALEDDFAADQMIRETAQAYGITMTDSGAGCGYRDNGGETLDVDAAEAFAEELSYYEGVDVDISNEADDEGFLA